MNAPTLVRGSSTRLVDGKPVAIDYAYTARRSTIFDEQLIAAAERRAAESKRIRAGRIP
jgi:hypothetical protein